MFECTNDQTALTFPHSRGLLTLLVSGKVDFPIVRFLHWGRTTSSLTSHIQERWTIRAIVLDTLAGPGFADFMPGHRGSHHLLRLSGRRMMSRFSEWQP
jgi:hypothetical protein